MNNEPHCDWCASQEKRLLLRKPKMPAPKLQLVDESQQQNTDEITVVESPTYLQSKQLELVRKWATPKGYECRASESPDGVPRILVERKNRWFGRLLLAQITSRHAQPEKVYSINVYNGMDLDDAKELARLVGFHQIVLE